MVHRLRQLPPLLCLIVIALAIPHTVAAQEIPTKWYALSAPHGAITQLAASQDGQTVYAVSSVTVNRQADLTQVRDAGTPRGADALYRSVDRGATWAAVTNDLPPGTITELYVDATDGSVWIGLNERSTEIQPRSGPWRSVDRGRTWRRVPLDRENLLIRSIVRDAGGDLLLAAQGAVDGWASYVYRSADGGATWTSTELPRGEGLPSDGLARLLAHPSDSQSLFAVMASGDLLVSGDGGTTWTCNEDALICQASRRQSQLVVEPDRGSALVLLGGRGSAWSVLRSVDGGKTWSDMRASGLPDVEAGVGAAAALGDGVLLLASPAGVYRSVNAGATWQPLEGALSAGKVHRFAVLPRAGSSTATVLAATGYGIVASGDAGSLWRSYGTGLPANAPLDGLLTHPGQPAQLIAPLRHDGRGPAVLISRDGGQAWLPSDGGIPTGGATAWAMDPANSLGFALAGWEHVSVTTDGGATWKTELVPFGQRTAIAYAPSASDRIYVDGSPALRSMDGGATWLTMNVAPAPGSAPTEVRGIAVHPEDARRVWAGTADGVLQSLDGGVSWQKFGLDGLQVTWLSTGGSPDGGLAPLALFAGVRDNGIMRWTSAGGLLAGSPDWQPANAGLPSGSNILAFLPDSRSPGLLWATRNGGGVYRSTDHGESWQNAAIGVGDNLGVALAVNYTVPAGIYMATATAGIWSLGATRPEPAATQTPPRAATSTPNEETPRQGVDARIEVVWPHGFAPIEEARLANVGIRLFMPGSLQPPACGWRPQVVLRRALNTEPAQPVGEADQRTVDGQPFPYWETNDVDISAAREGTQKIYFMVTAGGVDTATSIWAHSADARTFFPEQQVPSGIATGTLDAVDARIQIVWPHDGQGQERSVAEADLANVDVTLFKHATRLTVPRDWRPGRVTLMGAWNQEVGRPLASNPAVAVRQAGAITYPVWEFNDVPVDRARDPANKLYLWVEVEGIQSYPTIWAHGADGRTFFPAADEPIQGCLP